MKGTEFVDAFKGKGIDAWEAAAFQLAKEGGLVAWPMVSLALSSPGHTATLDVASDYLAVGEGAGHGTDMVRLPLRPSTAQAIANLSGSLLPTPKLVYETWRQAATQLMPQPQENKGPDLSEYARHDRKVQAQLAGIATPGLVTGHKKDVVISNIYRPGYVLIYGWFWPSTFKLKSPAECKVKPPPTGCSQPIQPRSNIHVDSHVDYSHGIRLVSPVMVVDGQEMQTEAVLQDPELSKLLSDEGPVRVVRYPAQNSPIAQRPAHVAAYKKLNPWYGAARTTSLADQGLAEMMAQAEALEKRTP